MTFGRSLNGRMLSQSASLAAIVSGKIYNVIATKQWLVKATDKNTLDN